MICLSDTIADAEPDYPALLRALEQFGKSAMLSASAMRHTVLAFEELVMQEMLPKLRETQNGFPIRVNIEHSDADGSIAVSAAYGGARFDPLTDSDPLSAMIVKKLAKQTDFTFDSENRITVVF